MARYARRFQMKTYKEFAAQHAQADGLIRSLCSELGRLGKCATLNPAIGYVLRQRGFQTIMVTAQIACAEAPYVQEVEAGDHLWVLASDGSSLWHVDAANLFELWIWYSQNLAADRWERVARGKERAPDVSLEDLPLVWGLPSTQGIRVAPDTLSAKEPFFDYLEELGKRDVVLQMFHTHGFDDPYRFSEGVLQMEETLPLCSRSITKCL